MPDSHANFAYSSVATAPSPATTGTSLVVAAGEGALFPTPPFNATIWPAGERPLASTAEIVRVTAIATDTLTITREQEGTTARTIIAGDQIAATITNKTLTDIEIVYNVKAYGATGDGTTDDTTAIAAAISAISTAGGGTLFFAPGTYLCENVSFNVSKMRIVALAGTATLKKKTTGAASAILTKIGVSATDVVIDGLSFDSDNYTNAQGVLIQNGSHRTTVRNCRFTNGQLNVYLNPSANDVTITQNYFGEGWGILTHDNFVGARLNVSNNVFTGGTFGDAIQINTPGSPVSRPSAGATDVKIIGNTISGYQSATANQAIGIGLAHVQGCVISGNVVFNTKNDGIHIEDGCTNVTVSSNQVSGCQRAGINVINVASTKESCFSITITGNSVSACNTAASNLGGISISGAVGGRGFVIAGNVVDGCGDAALAQSWGIFLGFDNKDVVCVANIVRNTKGTATAGIRTSRLTNGRISFNRCYDSQGTATQDYGLSVVTDQTNVYVGGNDFSGNGTGAYDGSGIGTTSNYYGLHDDGIVDGFLGGNLAIADGKNLILNTSTGTKFGTATTQKLSIWNATPIVQPANTITTRKVLENIGLVATGGTAGPTVQAAVFDFTTDVASGDGKHYIHVPPSLNGLNLVYVHARVITAGTTNTTDIQIARTRSGSTVDMLSTKLTIDSTETGSDTAATAAVINTSNDDVATNDILRIDVDAVSTTPPKGLIVTLAFG